MLENLYPRDVFSYFEKISSIPRGSGNCRNIADYIESFAHEKGLCFERDHWDNVIIKKPGTSALANAPVVMLQGHLDMVCEKCPKVFTILKGIRCPCKRMEKKSGPRGQRLVQMMGLPLP